MLQPGWDASRVANGVEQNVHNAFGPEMELVCTRSFEMTFESVPGSVLQVSTLLRTMTVRGGFSKIALVSIIVSALTTGFSAATISFE